MIFTLYTIAITVQIKTNSSKQLPYVTLDDFSENYYMAHWLNKVYGQMMQHWVQYPAQLQRVLILISTLSHFGKVARDTRWCNFEVACNLVWCVPGILLINCQNYPFSCTKLSFFMHKMLPSHQEDFKWIFERRIKLNKFWVPFSLQYLSRQNSRWKSKSKLAAISMRFVAVKSQRFRNFMQLVCDLRKNWSKQGT